jgi:hypothetical protein
MKFWIFVICAATALVSAPPAKAFCQVPQPRLVCAEYFASQLVVESTLVRTRSLHDKDDPEGISGYEYTLQINQILRGKIAGKIHVYEGNDSGRATFDWVSGRKYLLFLFFSTSDKAWELDGCGNSGPLSEASSVLSEIAAIQAARGGGVIHGVVRGSEHVSATTIPGVRVEAQGTTGHYAATTNEKGEFQISVPVGQYVVSAYKNGTTFDTADFSYEDLRKVRIEPGGCAQVEFAEIEPSPAQ